MAETSIQPTDEERRRAACLAMAKAPGLIRFAARYTRSLHDAEDAYQRAMEIVLTRAPVVEERRFMAWLHTVLRHEAMEVARRGRREGPGHEADVADAYAERLEEVAETHAVAEWRERYRSMQDALAGLTEAQRICLMLQSAGASYRAIEEVTGFSARKVERSVLEGRDNLRRYEVRLASGAVCARLAPAVDRVAAEEADSGERRAVARHVRHCGHCRALLRDRREAGLWMAALVPAALVGGGALAAGAADPSPLLAWWERVTTGMTVRAGGAVQMALEAPGAALAKIGAGTAAVAVAGAAGGPFVIDAVREAAPSEPVAAIREIAPVGPARAAGAPAAVAAPAFDAAAAFANVRRAVVRERERERAAAEAARRAAAARAAASPPSPPAPPPPPASPPAPPSPAPAPAPAPSGPSPGAVAMEFGP